MTDKVEKYLDGAMSLAEILRADAKADVTGARALLEAQWAQMDTEEREACRRALEMMKDPRKLIAHLQSTLDEHKKEMH